MPGLVLLLELRQLMTALGASAGDPVWALQTAPTSLPWDSHIARIYGKNMERCAELSQAEADTLLVGQ